MAGMSSDENGEGEHRIVIDGSQLSFDGRQPAAIDDLSFDVAVEVIQAPSDLRRSKNMTNHSWSE
jgi:hypothetical protein